MRIPNGFIKESDGKYRRGAFVFEGGKILRESTLLPTDEHKKELEQTKFETLDACIREALQYSGDIGQELRTKDIYIDLVKEGEYKISEKQSNKTVAIITPDNNVYELKLTEVINQDDTKELAPEEGAEAPKEIKDLNEKPKELDELKETENTKWKVEIIVNGELSYLGRLTKDEIGEVLSVANSIDPNVAYTEEGKYMEADEDFIDSNELEEVNDNPDNTTVYDSCRFIRLPRNIEIIQNAIDQGKLTPTTCTVIGEPVVLSQSEFDDYCSNLRQSKEFLAKFKPEPADTTYTCIAVKGEHEGPTLLIDNSGTDTAQYVSIL